MAIQVRFILALTCMLASHCMPPPNNDESRQSSLATIADELIPIPPTRSSGELSSFATKIAFESQRIRGSISGINPQSNFELVLIRQIKEIGGLPRHQIKPLIVDLVNAESVACGGVPCSRVFGISEPEIDDFLDAAYRKISADEKLAKPEGLALRHLYLGSLKRGPGETVPPERSLAVRVIYQIAKFAGHSGVKIGDPNFHFMIDLYPGELKSAHRLSCTSEICEAEILKPVRLNMNLPVFLNTHLIVRYRVGTESSTGAIHHEAMIGGRITPVSIGDILSVTIDFWAEVEKSAKTNYKSVIKKYDCNLSVYCDVPWFSVGANFDREGIEFDHSITATANVGPLAKASPNLPAKTLRVEYKDLPEKIKTIKKSIESGHLGDVPSIDPDIFWSEFTGPRRRG